MNEKLIDEIFEECISIFNINYFLLNNEQNRFTIKYQIELHIQKNYVNSGKIFNFFIKIDVENNSEIINKYITFLGGYFELVKAGGVAERKHCNLQYRRMHSLSLLGI